MNMYNKIKNIFSDSAIQQLPESIKKRLKLLGYEKQTMKNSFEKVQNNNSSYYNNSDEDDTNNSITEKDNDDQILSKIIRVRNTLPIFPKDNAEIIQLQLKDFQTIDKSSVPMFLITQKATLKIKSDNKVMVQLFEKAGGLNKYKKLNSNIQKIQFLTQKVLYEMIILEETQHFISIKINNQNIFSIVKVMADKFNKAHNTESVEYTCNDLLILEVYNILNAHQILQQFLNHQQQIEWIHLVFVVALDFYISFGGANPENSYLKYDTIKGIQFPNWLYRRLDGTRIGYQTDQCLLKFKDMGGYEVWEKVALDEEKREEFLEKLKDSKFTNIDDFTYINACKIPTYFIEKFEKEFKRKVDNELSEIFNNFGGWDIYYESKDLDQLQGWENMLRTGLQQVFNIGKVVDYEIRNIDFPSGLQNVGAICYFNTSVQSLFQNISFIKLILSDIVEEKETTGNRYLSLLREMQILFINMALSCKSVIQPQNVTSIIQKLFQNEWEIGKHKDIHEFFIDFFLKYIARGVQELKQLRENKENDIELRRKLSNFQVNQEIMEKSEIFNLFQGKKIFYKIQKDEASDFIFKEGFDKEKEEFTFISLSIQYKDLYTSWDNGKKDINKDVNGEEKDGIIRKFTLEKISFIEELPKNLIFRINRDSQLNIKKEDEFIFDSEIFVDRFMAKNKEKVDQIDLKVKTQQKEISEMQVELQKLQQFGISQNSLQTILKDSLNILRKNQDPEKEENKFYILDSCKQQNEQIQISINLFEKMLSNITEKISFYENAIKLKNDEIAQHFKNLNQLKYYLHSIFIHIGTTSQYGHYYGYIKDFIKGNWKMYNDKIVQEIKEEEVFKIAKSNAYFLIYISEEEFYKQYKPQQINYCQIYKNCLHQQILDQIEKDNKNNYEQYGEYEEQKVHGFVPAIVQDYLEKQKSLTKLNKAIMKTQQDFKNKLQLAEFPQPTVSFYSFIYFQKIKCLEQDHNQNLQAKCQILQNIYNYLILDQAMKNCCKYDINTLNNNYKNSIQILKRFQSIFQDELIKKDDNDAFRITFHYATDLLMSPEELHELTVLKQSYKDQCFKLSVVKTLFEKIINQDFQSVYNILTYIDKTNISNLYLNFDPKRTIVIWIMSEIDEIILTKKNIQNLLKYVKLVVSFSRRFLSTDKNLIENQIAWLQDQIELIDNQETKEQLLQERNKLSIKDNLLQKKYSSTFGEINQEEFQKNKIGIFEDSIFKIEQLLESDEILKNLFNLIINAKEQIKPYEELNEKMFSQLQYLKKEQRIINKIIN